MTSVAALFAGIYEITRGDLERASFPLVRADEHFRGMASLRVTRLSEFWKDKTSTSHSSLLSCTEDIVRGLFAQRCSWAFILRGLPSEIQCWFAIDHNALDRSSLESLLRSNFAGIGFGAEQFDARSVASLQNAVTLTGTPSVALQVLNPPSGDQIEKLCRGLLGSSWMYVVSADPVDPAETARDVNEITEKIRDVRATFLLKTNPIDEENRTAQRYVDLLEAKLKRFEQGRISGMWNVRCVCYADHGMLAERARHILEAAFGGTNSLPDPVRVRDCSLGAPAHPLREPLTTSEVATLARLPQEDFPGFELTEYARFGVEPNRTTMVAPVKIGGILDRGSDTGNWLCISRDDFTKHGLIVGATGSGKTNSCFFLLDQIWDGGNGVPFLVIESAKSEYRDLAALQRFHGLKVFTVSDDTVSPLRLNPFEVPKGILVQTHIDYLKSLFAAAFVLYPPMPYVLEQSLQEIYEDRGWEIARSVNSRGADSTRSAPTLADLAAKIPVVVDRMGYEQRISMDVKAGLLARINQLRLGGGKGLLLNTRQSIDVSVLFEGPCVLELKQIVSDDEKAFIIGLLLIRLYEHRESHPQPRHGLAHVTLIEEAHRLLRNVSLDQGNDVTANPRGRAVEVFSNILSEIRAFGEGILVAEQIPSKLAPDVIKNTGFKLIHRLSSFDDRELLGNSVNLNDAQIRHIGILQVGEGVAWTEHTRKATLVRVPLSASKKSAESGLSDSDLRSRMIAVGAISAPDLVPYEACKACPTSVSRLCTFQVQEQPDRALLDAFARLFNALRMGTSAILPAYAEFRQLTQRGGRTAAFAHPYCTFVAMVEADVERRGEFRGWRFEDVDWVIASACQMTKLLDGAAQGEASTRIPNDLIGAFQVRCKALDKTDVFPYPGCRVCGAPCQFRFDMARVRSGLSLEFQKAFLDIRNKTDELIELALQAAKGSFFLSDRGAVLGASFCFIVQQLAHPGLSLAMYYQHEMAMMLREKIMGRKGEQHGERER